MSCFFILSILFSASSVCSVAKIVKRKYRVTVAEFERKPDGGYEKGR